MDFLQKLSFPAVNRRDFDLETEMREQDESARRAQRNLLIAIVLVGALAVLAYVGGLPAGTVLFGVTVAVLAVAFAMITLARRSIRRNFGPGRSS